MSSPSDFIRSDHSLRMSPSSDHLFGHDFYRPYRHSVLEPSSPNSGLSISQRNSYHSLYNYISPTSPLHHAESGMTINPAWKWDDPKNDVNGHDWQFVSANDEFDESGLHYSDTDISQDQSIASQMMPSLTNSTRSLSPYNLLTSQDSPQPSVGIENKEQEENESAEEAETEFGQELHGEKKRVQRRQGVTCDQCRSKHVRCIARDYQQGNDEDREREKKQQTQCERCHEKGLDCTRNYSPPSRRYPRPSRTGKRIEQARMIHGTLSNQGVSSTTWNNRLLPEMLMHARPKLFSSTNPISDAHISNRIMAGSTSLRLLTCFFATAHMQMPIVDFHNFSARYNFSQGNCRTMSIMANGGDSSKNVPSAKQSAPGLNSTFWPLDAKTKTSRISTLSTPGSSEALIAVMHAWAALYTDIPVAFGGPNALLLSKGDLNDSNMQGSNERIPPIDAERREGEVPTQLNNEYVMGANGKLRRVKRKSGVACDTCRLRRLRCDKLERPEGMGCSRCEDKRIVCTDDYIQYKRKKTESQNDSNSTPKELSGMLQRADANEMEEINNEGLVGSAPSTAKDVINYEMNASSLQQQSWIDQGLQVPGRYRFGKSKEALTFGKARQPFFQTLLEKAINLVVKHQLIINPSVEGIQALMLLAQIVDLARHRKGDVFAEAAAHHITSLNLESNYEVDETDRKAVEQILGHMQRRRLWCCTWTRDAIVSGLYRKSPRFTAERAFSIRGSRSVAASRDASSTSSGQATRDSSDFRSLSDSSAEKDKDESENNADLNGEMGLSFSILALMQVGALSRFMARNIDNATLPIEYGNIDDASIYEIHKMKKACQALWKSIDSLLSFFDQCSLKARHNMDQLQPFQPLGWIATIKIAGAMLELATFRNLAERLQRANLIFSSPEKQQQGVFQQMQQHPLIELKVLVEESRQRSLNTCRRIAKLVEFLLDKDVFQTSGIILRQLLPVTQFLARMPCEVIDPLSHQFNAAAAAATSGRQSKCNVTLASMPMAEMQHQQQVIDPREIFSNASTKKSILSMSTMSHLQDQEIHLRQGHVPEFIFSNQLAPFDSIQKKREINHCLEALAQIGYSWPTMDVEIAYIEKMMEDEHL